jgi:nucleotide-binding universal stress UspA family protein
MKNIIVPIDFSPESLNGLRMAILFTQKIRSDIHLLYVLQKNNETDGELEKDQKTAEDKFVKILADFKPKLGNESTIQYVISHGRIFQEVVSLADKLEDSMITTSTHGASGFQELFIGSNAFRIISATDKPVITLRKNYCPAQIGKIVLPIDLSPDSRQKVPATAEIAKIFGAEVHVVGIHTSRSMLNMKKIRTYASQVAGFIEAKVRCESNEVFGDNIPEMVSNYAKTIKADLIAITTEKSSGLSLIMGNTAHQLLNRAEVPVLCLTPKHITRSGSFASMGG